MEWKISSEPVPYEDAIALMEARAQAIREEGAPELVWLLEHPALYTGGTGAKPGDLLDTLGFPVYDTGRGGQYTYHGPGQRVAYVMLDLKKRTPDVRLYVQNLEHWIIATLAEFRVKGFIREGRVGVWVDSSPSRGEAGRGAEGTHRYPIANICAQTSPHPTPPPRGEGVIKESKIAAIGVRIRKWVTYHGISLNVHPDLSHYRGIVPCGLKEYGVTSLEALGVAASLQDVDEALKQHFARIFTEPAKDR